MTANDMLPETKPMGTHRERRTKWSDEDATKKPGCGRQKNESLIGWSFLSLERFFDGKVLNWSRDGIGFKTDQCIQPGAVICLRVKKYRTGDCVAEGKQCWQTNMLAEVKWCCRTESFHHDSYRVGAKYLIF